LPFHLARSSKKENDVTTQLFRGFTFGASVLSVCCIAWTQPRAEEKDTAALAVAVKETHVTLEQGLVSAAKNGRPISAKFEIEDSKIQLSAYVQGAGGFKEIVLDPKSGKSMSVEKITDAGDLKDAQEQSTAMAKAKETLLAAVQHAIAANRGARVISVYPEIQRGHAIAIITISKEDGFSKINEKLD
jgi:hypothetical protein